MSFKNARPVRAFARVYVCARVFLRLGVFLEKRKGEGWEQGGACKEGN